MYSRNRAQRLPAGTYFWQAVREVLTTYLALRFDTALRVLRYSRSCGGTMALIETEEAARRLARAIASDLSLYNEEKVVEGITNDSLYEVMAEELEEGRALFQSRVTPELYAKNFYDRAVIDILVRSKAHIESRLW
jgi:hypothetical protein